jgi:FimV-like protein
MTLARRPASRLFQRTALCAALSLSLLGSAQALTLNRPVVQSKQGQALLAEIDIYQLSEAERAEFQASLASAEAYKAARIEAPNNDGQGIDIKVELLKRSGNGLPYLKITSTKPVNTSFVDLLLEFRWATGRMLRDISLSVDNAKETKTVAVAAAPSAAQTTDSDNHIRVKRGDTASNLVAPEMGEGVSLDQMLVALLRSNPDAFVESNVNRLKTGALLKLPTEEEAKKISRADARNEILIQSKDFDAYRAALAARAPGGVIEKASNDAKGQLSAKVENKAKTDQDKLTLSKPGKGEAEAKIAKEREAKEVADRAAEISRNIAELGKIAAATANEENSASPAPLPTPSQTASAASEPAAEPASAAVAAPLDAASSANAQANELLDKISNDPNTPIAAGALVAFLLLIALFRRATTQKDEPEVAGLPPLDVKFDLNLPSEPEMAHTADMHNPEAETALNVAKEAAEHSEAVQQAVRPTMQMPNISLDLVEPNDHPFQVRIDLAEELWKLGQLHTSRALMEEVANEASGDVKAKAEQWLAERE